MRYVLFLLLCLLTEWSHAGPPIIFGGGADTAKLLTTNLVNKNGEAVGVNYTPGSSVQGLDLVSIHAVDFITNSNFADLNSVASGTSAAAQADDTGVNSTEKAIGVYKCQTGTDTTGRCHVGGINLNNLRATDQALQYGWRAMLGAVSDGTDTYAAHIGFFDSLTASAANGIYFRYTHGTNSGKWQCVAVNNSTETATDSTVAANTVYNVFEISVNQAGTQALFYINGTLVCTVTTNLPDSSRVFTHGVQIIKSAGTTNRNFHFDWMYFKITRTTAR